MPRNQLGFDFNAPLPSLPQLWTPEDIYVSLDQQTVQRFKEDSRLERKRGRLSQRDLSEYISMWANTQPPGGIILIGIEDKGTISGRKQIETEHLNDIESARRLCPDARYEHKRVPVINAKNEDDFIVAIRVLYREDKLVETTSGDAFIREGEDKRNLPKQKSVKFG